MLLPHLTRNDKKHLTYFYQVSLLLLGYSVAGSGVMYRPSLFGSLFLNTKNKTFSFWVLNICLIHDRDNKREHQD